jgi:hypothetical protein
LIVINKKKKMSHIDNQELSIQLKLPYILLCGFFVLFLMALGVVRFYRSMANRTRQYQLEYLKHFNMLNEDLFNRLLKSKQRKSAILTPSASRRTIGSVAAQVDLDDHQLSDPDEDRRSELTDADSSVTILSLRSSSLDDYRTILDGRKVKSRVMYDLESIVRESVVGEKKKKRRRRSSRVMSVASTGTDGTVITTHHVRRCKNPKCKKNHTVKRKHHIKKRRDKVVSDQVITGEGLEEKCVVDDDDKVYSEEPVVVFAVKNELVPSARVSFEHEVYEKVDDTRSEKCQIKSRESLGEGRINVADEKFVLKETAVTCVIENECTPSSGLDLKTDNEVIDKHVGEKSTENDFI